MNSFEEIVSRDPYLADLLDALEAEDLARTRFVIFAYMHALAQREETAALAEIDRVMRARARRARPLNGEEAEHLANLHARFAVWRARRVAMQRRVARAEDHLIELKAAA
jgi:hypothetical protein